eukprot:10627964-Prorocentrum_lima.AAC.1
MTSSLVGSEMCIRDSTKGDKPQIKLAKSCWMKHFLHLQGTALKSSQRGCLLYTSDAADDM